LPGFKPHDDDTPGHCAANRAGGEALLRVLLEESGEFRLIGEDLGVVPDYVRPSLASLGIAGFKIPQWEPGPDFALLPGASYPRLSLTTYATHDHDPLRSVWERWVEALEAADGGEITRFDDANRARWEMQLLLDFAGPGWRANAFPWAENLHLHLLRGLFASNAWIAVAMITDLFGTSERFNVPGSIADSNWSRRLQGTPARWRKMPGRAALMRKISRLLTDTGRA
jgi:4-alpha-glucanotransferase